MPCRNAMFSVSTPITRSKAFTKSRIRLAPYGGFAQDAGYHAGYPGQGQSFLPYQPYAWDEDLTILPDGEKAHIKDIAYGESTARDCQCQKGGKPFFLSVNISDLTNPLVASSGGKKTPAPSRIFQGNEACPRLSLR